MQQSLTMFCLETNTWEKTLQDVWPTGEEVWISMLLQLVHLNLTVVCAA